MAKIGIVTFCNTVDNYGQVLQYLATQEYLKLLGHEPYLIVSNGFKSVWSKFKNKLTSLFIKLFSFFNSKEKHITDNDYKKNVLFTKWVEITNKSEINHPRNFKKFRLNNFRIIDGYYEDIIREGFDCFGVGSDQTWSSSGIHYMLGWVPDNVKKISLAPSVGHKEFSDSECRVVKKYLASFSFITVREQNGIDLCNRCGRPDAIKVLDPVFLIDSSIYDKFLVPANCDKPYIFIYLLGGEISLKLEEILNFCKNNGYEVKYVESQGRCEDCCDKLYASVDEWLGLIKGASYVITNSFHGMALSIIYHKPFMVFPLIGVMESMNQRIINLATSFDLNSRIYTNNLQVLFDSIDWLCIDKKILENKTMVNELFVKFV